jgi:serine/threonine-protein kinase
VADGLIARQFAGYRIDSRVGRGGMGVVYRATDLALDRTVALKVLDDELARDPAFRRRFVTESKLAASLDHPNVIPIYAAGESDGMPFIAMRFVPGADLRTVLRSEGRLEPERAARVIAQVASALDAAHAHDLVHRDVKPANVLVTPEGHVYLTDFGLTKRVSPDTDATRTGVVLGTLNYMAPEQIRGSTIGPYTDVYSLGCMIVHLLTGQVPFPVETEEAKLWAHVSERPPRPSERVPGLGEAFDPIVSRAMAKVPEQRFATAGEVGEAMLEAVRPPAPVAVPVAAAPAAAPPPAEPQRAVPGRAPRARAPRAPEHRELLIAALTDRFNVGVLAGLLVIGAVIGAIGLMVPLAVLVYAAAVWRAYRDPATARRLAAELEEGRRG